jgi:hypothetical protein
MMKYQVILQKTEEGYSVFCPGLPGCWSQGETEPEALENIHDASGVSGGHRGELRRRRSAAGGSRRLSMPKIAGIPHAAAIRALGKTGFRVVRQGKKHLVMSDGRRFLTIPRANPINA